MKVTGGATLSAPIDTVWTALNDPAVLVRTIPGCERLEATGPDSYRLTITTGMAAIRGTYTGEVSLADQQPPGSFTLKASGAGSPGTVSTDVRVRLAATDDGTTTLSYDADAVVGGVIAGVGQRMLAGVAKRMADQFFCSVDEVLTAAPSLAGGLADQGQVSVPSGPVPIGAGQVGAGQVGAGQAGASQAGASQAGAGQAQPGVYLAPKPAGRQPAFGAAGFGGSGFAVGALVGGAIALAGALVGAAIAGRLIGRRDR
jgi:hypothetical protein